MRATSVTLGLAASLVAPAAAYIRFGCATNIVEERADPIVAPHEVAAHTHKIVGGNAFNMNRLMTYNQARQSTCSSCPIKEDLSNYWTPKLYYQAQNGSFISVPMVGDNAEDLNGGMVVYYQQRGPDHSTLKAFPKGFRMLAGNPFARSFVEDSFAADAINFACLGANQPETNYIPDYNCPDGLRAQVYFPSCWDGVNLDSSDHKSHMSYPANNSHDNGPCPASHPVQLVSLFFEVLYDTNSFADMWHGNGHPFVFAQGDPTGYGFHGDFINGWDVDVLQDVIEQCTNDSAFGSIDKADCPPINQFSSDEMKQCKVAPQVKEQVRGLLPKLPGCNPVQSGPEAAKPATCANVTAASIESEQSVQDATFTDMTDQGWSYIGCSTDSSDRTLTGKTTIYTAADDTMTVAQCLKFCKGSTYAGLEYGQQCFCGDDLPASAAPKAGILGQCNMPCEGDSNQICGGNWALSTYKVCNSGDCKNQLPAGISKRSSDVVERSMSKLNKKNAHLMDDGETAFWFEDEQVEKRRAVVRQRRSRVFHRDY